MIKKIEGNFQEIVNMFNKRSNDVEKYIKIKNEYDKGCDTENNSKFQDLYKSFYVMRIAGLTDEYFDRYFKILNKRTFNKRDDLFDFLIEMDGIKTRQGHNSLQFSFATKLLHTANNDLPIYDKHVQNFFGIRNINDAGEEISIRAEKRQAVYNGLCSDFNEVLSQEKTKEILKKIRLEINIPQIEIVSDSKFFDFVIWLNGQCE